MQRVHQHDLTGYLLERLPQDWTVLNLPAIAEEYEEIEIGPDVFHRRQPGEALHPEREPLHVLESMRRELGSDIFSAQFQQSPVPPGGAMIHRSWLRYYDQPPERTYRCRVIQSWDTAGKAGAQNSWSVCTTWLVLDKHFYLLDLTRGRYEYPQLRDVATALAERFRPNSILIEDASTGIALAQDLKKAGQYAVRPVTPEKDKVTRLYVQQAKFEAGQVLFPRNASFIPALEAELLKFPQSKASDQVDSISQALASPVSKYGSYDTSMNWVMG
jgi:predicted phage terminase large subunit-like protein